LRLDPQLAEHPSIVNSAGILLGTILVCALVAAWISSQREFHVKTPEQA
jgi:hypothetical protein